jgi:predicted Zn finger-like uncharacterized protein
MPIHAICPSCRAEYHLPDRQAGKKVRCKQCQDTFKVLAASEEEPADVIEAEVVDAEEDVVEAAEAPLRQAITPSLASKSHGPSAPASRDKGHRVRTQTDPDAVADEDVEEMPRRQARSKTPWIIGAAVAGVILVGGGGLLMALLLWEDSPTPQVATNPPTNSPILPVTRPPETKAPEAKAPEAQPPQDKGPPAIVPQPSLQLPPVAVQPTPVSPNPGQSTEARPGNSPSEGTDNKSPLEKAKKATVYLEVEDAHGRQATGSGFFGVPGARNLVLTNAHVVGMLAPDSQRPRTIKVFLNSGQADEKELRAIVLGVDRVADLAVLDVKSTDGMPEPLQVGTSVALSPGQKLWVFGFPVGRQRGKEVTSSPAAVVAVLKTNDAVDKIQVNGGMAPGSSGGPVVDLNGQVVGVAVSGIPGRQVHFAIPGELVQGIVKGRAAPLNLGLPFYAAGEKVGVPVTLEMFDPLDHVKQVAVEVWASDAGAAPRPGDSSRQKIPLTYENHLAKGEVLLPDSSAAKTYWLQPTWVNTKGESLTAAATSFKLDPNISPLRRDKPYGLHLRHSRGAHPLSLDIKFQVGANDDPEVTRMETHFGFRENVVNVDAAGAATIDLQYTQAERFRTFHQNDRRPDETFQQIAKEKPLFNAMHAQLRMDTHGNITQGGLDKMRLRSPTFSAEVIKHAEDFHAPVLSALQGVSITMPSKKTGEVTAVGESWKAPLHSVPLESPGKKETGYLDLTYTYLGQRFHDKHSEAVIAIKGKARVGKATAPISGDVNGLAVLNLATGQLSLVEIKVIVDMEVVLAEPGETATPVRAIATFDFLAKRN